MPNDPDIYIEERSAMNVAALRFPGFPGDIDFSIKVRMEAATLGPEFRPLLGSHV